MSDWKSEVQVQLGEVARELDAIRYRLLGIAASLRSPQDETARLLGVGVPEDAAADTLSIVECVLVDRLGPAIRELSTAVEGED